MRSTSYIAGAAPLCLLVAAALAACGPPKTAGEAVRPHEMKAGEALRGDGAEAVCSASDDDRTLIVDLATEDRKDMENMLRQGRVPVVSYDCKSFKLLRRCKLEAKFEYLGSSPRKNVRSLENADAISAEVPLASAKLRASVASGRKVDIALAEVGTRSSSFELVARTELTGIEPKDCDAATHFVRGADVGAFAIAQRTSGEAAAAAQIFTAGASGASKSQINSMNSEGKLETCENAKESDNDAPEGCRVPLRLHLRRIIADAKEKEAKAHAREVAMGGGSGKRPTASFSAAPCPKDLVRAEGGSCVAPSPNIRFQCRGRDIEECKTQCDKGHLGSCARYGSILMRGSPAVGGRPHVNADPKGAIVALEKACNRKNANAQPIGCDQLAAAYKREIFPRFEPGKPPPHPPSEAQRAAARQKAMAVLDYACKHLDREGCYGLAREHEWQKAPDMDRALHYYKRACTLGSLGACQTAARLLIEGKKSLSGAVVLQPNAREGLSLLDSACTGGSTSACSQLSSYLASDRFGVKDLKRAAALFKGLCDRKSSSGCAEYALLQLKGDGGVNANAGAARETLERLCFDSNVAIACYGVGRLKEAGTAGVAEDGGKAVEYYKKYPYVKDAAVRAARLLEKGAKNLPKNVEDASQLYGRACMSWANSDVGVCRSAAAGAGEDPRRQYGYLRAACRLGDKVSCKKAKPPPIARRPRPDESDGNDDDDQ